jgi:hypothetical protein
MTDLLMKATVVFGTDKWMGMKIDDFKAHFGASRGVVFYAFIIAKSIGEVKPFDIKRTVFHFFNFYF